MQIPACLGPSIIPCLHKLVIFLKIDFQDYPQGTVGARLHIPFLGKVKYETGIIKRPYPSEIKEGLDIGRASCYRHRSRNGVGCSSYEISMRNRIGETGGKYFFENDGSVRIRAITVSVSEIGQLDQLILDRSTRYL